MGPHETNAYLLLYESTAGFFGDDDVEEGRHHRGRLDPSEVPTPSASISPTTTMLQRPNDLATSSDGAVDLADENTRGIVASSTIDSGGGSYGASDERGGQSKNGPAKHTTAVDGSQGSLEVPHAEGCDVGNSDFDVPAPTAPLVAAAPTEAVSPVEASDRDGNHGGEGGEGGGRGNGEVFTAGAEENPQTLDALDEKQGPFHVKMQTRSVDSKEWGMGWSSDFGSR